MISMTMSEGFDWAAAVALAILISMAVRTGVFTVLCIVQSAFSRQVVTETVEILNVGYRLTLRRVERLAEACQAQERVLALYDARHEFYNRPVNGLAA